MSQYILLPKTGIRSLRGSLARAALLELPFTKSTESSKSTIVQAAEVNIIDSINEDGPKLAEMDDNSADKINQIDSPLRAVPLVTYGNPMPNLGMGLSANTAAIVNTVTIKCTDQNTGAAVSDAEVIAITDTINQKGAKGITDANGEVLLSLSGNNIEHLYVLPLNGTGYWAAFRINEPMATYITIALTPVDLGFVDSVRHFYSNTSFNVNAGVNVGILDTGIGPHSDLNIISGNNTVTGEPASDWQDGHYHGTHVAGLVGANGLSSNGLRGVAPGVALHAYRVFAHGGDGATNYAIMKAMIKAEGTCDILNLSLGSKANGTITGVDAIIMEAVQAARDDGMIVIVAAGNDGRKPVGSPASYPDATAVSAMGVEGTFPVGTLDEKDIKRPPSSPQYGDEFIAAFSNIGPEISITGPGVGTLSTLPNQKYGPLSGTSMAAPVVAGAAACLLSQHPEIFNMPRNRTRSDAIERLLLTNCVRRGFGINYEGFGLPDPLAV